MYDKEYFYEDFVEPLSVISATIAPISVPLLIIKLVFGVNYTWLQACIPLVISATFLSTFLFAIAIYFTIGFLWRMFT